MILLTHRDACRETLRKIVLRIPNWRPIEERLKFARSFADAGRLIAAWSNDDVTMLVLDLGSIAKDPHLVRDVHAIVADRPWVTVILLAPMTEPAAELRAVQALRDVKYCTLVEGKDLGSYQRRWQQKPS